MNNVEVNPDTKTIPGTTWGMDGLSSQKVEYVEAFTLGRKGGGKGSCMHLTIAL